MTIKILGTTSGVEVDTDSSKAMLVSEGVAAIPSIGGFYTATGGPAGIVAAGLGSGTSLASIRYNPTSIRRAYVTKLRFVMSAATIGVTAGVAGQLGIQRFELITPSAGVARTPNKLDESFSRGSDMFDIRDNASNLTTTGAALREVVATTVIPLMTGTDELGHEWIFEPLYPVVLEPGQGLLLRTQTALAATQTWVFSYTYHWFEK